MSFRPAEDREQLRPGGYSCLKFKLQQQGICMTAPLHCNDQNALRIYFLIQDFIL